MDAIELKEEFNKLFPPEHIRMLELKIHNEGLKGSLPEIMWMCFAHGVLVGKENE